MHREAELDFGDPAQLHAACLSGERCVRDGAFQHLWKHVLFPYARKLCDRWADAEAAAEDIAQTALSSIWRKLDQVREADDFLKWARRAVSNAFIDEYNRRTMPASGASSKVLDHGNLTPPRQPRWEPLASGEDSDEGGNHRTSDDVEAQVIDAVWLDRLRGVLRRAPMLSPAEKPAIIHHICDGLTDAEIADLERERTGRPVLPSHVQVNRSRGLRKLQLAAYLPVLRLVGCDVDRPSPEPWSICHV